MSARLRLRTRVGDEVVYNTVRWFAPEVRGAWLEVECQRAGRDRCPNYGTALNVQVATKHWEKMRNGSIRLAAIDGEIILRKTIDS